MRNNFWRPSKKAYGLFDVWKFADSEVVVSSGVGGGSLVYANVLIRKDEDWFVKDRRCGEPYEYWPVTRKELDPYYDEAEKILGGSVYPQKYASDNKTAAMREAAIARGIAVTTYDKIDPKAAQFYLPLLAISFAPGNDPPGTPIPDSRNNIHGRSRETCRLCGECDIGCNYGAKNTLDYTYLSRAAKKGAQIRHLCEAETIEWVDRDRIDRGYKITYTVHDTKTGEKRKAAVTASRLILACGTLGTTLLLMRNKENLPALEQLPALGHRFSGNGDYLAFAIKCRKQYGNGFAMRPLDASCAPVITSTFRFPDTSDGADGRGCYLQDAGYPLLADYLWEMLDVNWFWRFLAFIQRVVFNVFQNPRKPDREIGGELKLLLGKGALSYTSMPMLGIGRDVPSGVITIDDRRLQLDWNDAPSKPFYRRLRSEARAVAEKMGGDYYENPLMKLFNNVITVHPLGGCSMGRDKIEGVVDSYGRVFGCENLYIADGSVMPGPVGTNPSLTIAALAERFADHLGTKVPWPT
jgi:cholesterol oxidase